MFSLASSWKSQLGYTLMEMFIVAGIVMVGSAVAIPVTMQMVRSSRGDSALILTSTFLRTARGRAIAERRNIRLTFTDNTIVAERVEVPSGDLTVVDTLLLEDGYVFERDELPNTPDKFSVAAGDAVDFTGDEPVMFTSDGSLLDAAGDVTNGVLFMSKPNAEDQGRAVAIWGTTGMIRGWRWGGSEWIQ
jgi:Tfp pilus assembly protein FimT